MESRSDVYASAGVDITAGYRSVELMKEHIKRTMTKGVVSDVGGFGGLFELDLEGIKKPVLVSGTDGVGAKLKIAFLMDKHDTVGIDCVAMCVNDIICCGAKPLFFLDYIACGKNVPERIADIVKGVVDKDKIINNATMQEGDAVIALASSGVHSNGFSLVRKVFDVENKDIKTPVDELGGKSIGECLLTPTKIYVKPVLALLEKANVKAISHITGGGFYENIPRSIPDGFGAQIERSKVKVLPIFDMIAKAGNIEERDMFNTFNMGVGMSIIVDKNDADLAVQVLKDAGEDAYIMGEVVKSEEKVSIR